MPYTWSVDKATNWICSGAETLGSFRGRIRDAAYIRAAGLNARAWCSREPVPFTKRKTGPGKPLEVGKRWGRNFDCAWIHFTGRVPESAAGKAVALKIELGGEGCVFDNTGRPVQGLTNVWTRGPWDEGKMIVDISSRAKGGDPIDLWVDAGANGLFGYSEEQNGGKLNIADICVCNPEMKALFYDFVTLHDLSDQLEDRSARRHQILGALFDAILVLRDFTNAEAKRARAILKPELKKRNGDASLVVSAIGHAHLDLSWLWPERETYRKGARTFATVLHFMQKYPDYAFGASQPQLYQWIKDKYPSLYSGIKKRVAEGRWEAQGALWVESDTNVPCCESLVRQILYGKRFFRDEFGKDMKITYLPDVFGYSAALPQIMKKAGVPYFMTQKMSWSTRNKFPHHTFHWQGIDGSTVLSHMLPNNNYNADVSPSTVMECERNYADKMVSDRSLMLFGIGDGGGGPGEGHLERLARSKNLAGMPPVVQESALAFFRRIEKDKGRYARWQGELYLEQHRGTYTSQAYCKAYNRKMEIALRDLELAAGLAGRLAGARYPRKELEALWKEVLLYQFHDILPGSSIKRAYDETYARYRVILKETRALARKAKGALLNRIDRKGRAPVVVVNQLSWRRHEWVKAGRRWLKAAVPSMGHAVADGSVREKMPKTVCCSERALENDLLRIRFDKDGWITSIFDKQNKREAIAGGEKANKLVLFDDTADAWNLQQDYHHRPPRPVRLIKTAARIDGPRGIVTQTRVYGKSQIVQQIVVTAGSRRIDFVTEVDWQESKKMLRSLFPIAVMADEVNCGIQSGHIRRPTHQNTSWDVAKFEVCAQGWIDLSQPDYGVAILKEAKYGHRAAGNVVDINLLRGTEHPGVMADRGRHEFTYAVLPHAGDHLQGDVIREAQQLNVPLQVMPVKPGRGDIPACHSFMEVDAANVIIDAVKKAEDSDALMVRMYEAHGKNANAKLSFGFPVKRAQLVDLMEEHPKAVRVSGSGVKLSFTPFEIKTLRVS